MKITNVIIAEQGIPSPKNGSWTQRLEFFLKSEFNNIDYLICSHSDLKITTSSNFLYAKKGESRILNKIYPKNRYSKFIEKINILLNNQDHLILCVIDNVKLLNAVSNFIDAKSLRNKITLLFYNCGYSYFLNQIEHEKFSKNIDEFIFLTKSAYLYNKKIYKEFTSEVTILNNPINKKIFNTEITDNSIQDIVIKNNLEDKTVYLWLSHDRKKKGMTLILNAWKSWVNKNDDCVLLIVGAKRDVVIKNVIFIGEVKSDEVYKYYKLSDVYLFPTLWKEGFGLSLSQAICSGCFCIAANNGGVSDFFTKKDGVLINEPNIVENWAKSMQLAYSELKKGWINENCGFQILTFEEWSIEFSMILNKWNQRLKA